MQQRTDHSSMPFQGIKGAHIHDTAPTLLSSPPPPSLLSLPCRRCVLDARQLPTVRHYAHRSLHPCLYKPRSQIIRRSQQDPWPHTTGTFPVTSCYSSHSQFRPTMSRLPSLPALSLPRPRLSERELPKTYLTRTRIDLSEPFSTHQGRSSPGFRLVKRLYRGAL